MYGILIAAILIFVFSFPLAYFSSKYNIDLDLLSRSSGFGYYGSILTNIIFASFTVIFFSLEGSIMAQGFYHVLGLPKQIGYVVSTIIIFLPVLYGMSLLSKLQKYSNFIWIFLMIIPFLFLYFKDRSYHSFFVNFRGVNGYETALSVSVQAAGVCLSLMSQIAEQIDYLRFMPTQTKENKKKWWFSVIIAGPGWVIFGAIKQVIGMYIGVYLFQQQNSQELATEPVNQFNILYSLMFPKWLASTISLLLVVLSQIKINVTNAYSGSIAWANVSTRIFKKRPDYTIFLTVQLGLCILLMECDIFSFLNSLLSFYANTAIAWVTSVASDLVFNRTFFGYSPRVPEFRRGMIYPLNPVGFCSVLFSSFLSFLAYFGAFGETYKPYSPIIAVLFALVFPPIIAISTCGMFYTRRDDDGIPIERFDYSTGLLSTKLLQCHICNGFFERPDMLLCSIHQNYSCSLCLDIDTKKEHPLVSNKSELSWKESFSKWKRRGEQITSI